VRPRIDVSDLPTTVYGHRAPLWWGVVGLIVIESMVFALLVGVYYYLRGGETVWPPPGDDPPVTLPAINLVLLLASAIPMHLVVRETDRTDLRRMRFWLLVCTVMGVLFLVGRAFTLSQMGFRWDSHAYGSIVWAFAGLHSIHALTSVGENVLFLALLFKGPVEEKHLLDLRLNALYWYFVVVSWAVLFAVIYFDSGLWKDA
jgi:heme/copper-type cytochrome/quinol oxidase subunit 3